MFPTVESDYIRPRSFLQDLSTEGISGLTGRIRPVPIRLDLESHDCAEVYISTCRHHGTEYGSRELHVHSNQYVFIASVQLF